MALLTDVSARGGRSQWSCTNGGGGVIYKACPSFGASPTGAEEQEAACVALEDYPPFGVCGTPGLPPLRSPPPSHWLQVSVEERVVARVALKAATFGQDVGESTSSGGDGSGGGADPAGGE